MKIPVWIVSGFLGAGKTTYIQQLLSSMGNQNKTMVIENDFGSVSYDADVLASQGVRLKALPSGCICCSLAGNFLQALHSVLTKADVERIIIEPSGVAKVSDVLRVCERPELRDKIMIVQVVTVVDGQKGLFYLQNFGEFFADQIRYADTIFVNRIDSGAEWYDEMMERFRQVNGHAYIATMLEDAISFVPKDQRLQNLPEEHDHDHDHHHGDEIFTAVTLEAADILSLQQWKEKVEGLLETEKGLILRLKGIVPSLKGYISIQYSGGPLEVVYTDVKGQTLTVIGSAIDAEDIQRRWAS